MIRLVDPREVRYVANDSGVLLGLQRMPPSSPTFSATYLAPAGYGYDPPRLHGLARAASRLLTAGAGRRDRRQFARVLDAAGATISSRIDAEVVATTLWGPVWAAESLAELFADALFRPRFDPKEVERVRSELHVERMREATQPSARAERELAEAIFPPGHPYRRTGGGSARCLDAIGREEIVHFHSEHFPVAGAALVVTLPAGRRLPRAIVRRFLRSRRLAGPRPPRWPRRSMPPSKKTVRLEGGSQVEIRLGGPALPRADKQYPALFLANEVLGGRPAIARLFQRVRERRGLAYDASSELWAGRWGGSWTVAAGTSPDRWPTTLSLLTEELERLTQQGIPERELTATRESVIGEIPTALETTADAHALAEEVVRFHLPETFWIDWPKCLRSLGSEAVRVAAAQVYGGSAFAQVVVGPLGPGHGRAGPRPRLVRS